MKVSDLQYLVLSGSLARFYVINSESFEVSGSDVYKQQGG